MYFNESRSFNHQYWRSCPFEQNGYYTYDPMRINPILAAIASTFVAVIVFVIQKIGGDVYQYGDIVAKCAKEHPYDFDAIEKCLRENGLNGTDARRVRNRIEMAYDSYMYAMIKTHYPTPEGTWQTQYGKIKFKMTDITEEMPFPFFKTPIEQYITGVKVEGNYDWAPGGKLVGLLTNEGNTGILRGYWSEHTNPEVTHHANRGNFIMRIKWDEKYKPYFEGSFGYEEKVNQKEWKGTKIEEH
ncbi:hypothetical protein [Clostridium sp. UBA6640]|uniref:hypothetical protein n=1 Tax=Clostridium sp. UBA6640 TaxID=1946370 RepID=UPI0025C0812B|nr:hypothetical protein [Clostridium sp. UBA6640]